MTRDEILRLEGQELVEAVARDVMGWEVKTRLNCFSGRDETIFIMPPAPDISRIRGGYNDFDPLADENHLAEVREKMIERGFETEIAYHRNIKHWQAIFLTDQVKSKRWKYDLWAGDESYALTLLRAALLAVHEEEK